MPRLSSWAPLQGQVVMMMMMMMMMMMAGGVLRNCDMVAEKIQAVIFIRNMDMETVINKSRWQQTPTWTSDV